MLSVLLFASVLATGCSRAETKPADKTQPRPRLATVRLAQVLMECNVSRQIDQQIRLRLAEARERLARKQEVRAALATQVEAAKAELARGTDESRGTDSGKSQRERLQRLTVSLQEADQEIAAMSGDPSLAQWAQDERKKIGDLVHATIKKVGARHDCDLVLDVTLTIGGIIPFTLVNESGRIPDLPDFTAEVVAEVNASTSTVNVRTVDSK